MDTSFHAVAISKNVYWVGAIDWNMRNFHGYATQRGSTYNAYLILGKEPILIDTVKEQFFEEMMQRIESVIDPQKIEYIVSNHAEMDHSGSLVKAIAVVKPKKVYASTMGIKALNKQLGNDLKLDSVKNGESLTLGNVNLKFIETRMLHWPDSMFTYYEEDGVLFSQDGFGMHLASMQRFSDEIDKTVLMHEVRKYYANIILPYSSVVQGLLNNLPKLDLKIRVIAPDHGPVWRKEEEVKWILDLYSSLVKQEKVKKAIIIYDTMWGSTDKMARAISDGLYSVGYDVKLMALDANNRSDIVLEVMDAEILLVGSPTINNGVFPSLADVLSYLKGLKPIGLRGQAFGSFGWSGEAVSIIKQSLEEMKVELVGESLRFQYVPTEEELTQCYAFGVKVGESI